MNDKILEAMSDELNDAIDLERYPSKAPKPDFVHTLPGSTLQSHYEMERDGAKVWVPIGELTVSELRGIRTGLLREHDTALAEAEGLQQVLLSRRSRS